MSADSDAPIRAILWDFGDTLADERWMLTPPGDEPAWSSAWLATMDALGPRWSIGDASSADVAVDVAARLAWPVERARAHMRATCERIDFYPGVRELIALAQVPQALVTVNPDIFSEVVAPAYGLTGIFAAIVTSWEEGTTDKAALATAAMRRLGADLMPPQCLLIDNLEPNVAAWKAVGGRAHHFTSPENLARAWPTFAFAEPG
jgi:beta-phosphoglucomutase-like phosphatase (HAD superfamily)